MLDDPRTPTFSRGSRSHQLNARTPARPIAPARTGRDHFGGVFGPLAVASANDPSNTWTGDAGRPAATNYVLRRCDRWRWSVRTRGCGALRGLDRLDVRIFGEPMSFWEAMPRGLLLRAPAEIASPHADLSSAQIREGQWHGTPTRPRHLWSSSATAIGSSKGPFPRSIVAVSRWSHGSTADSSWSLTMAGRWPQLGW